jgi:hypothetical protein
LKRREQFGTPACISPGLGVDIYLLSTEILTYFLERHVLTGVIQLFENSSLNDLCSTSGCCVVPKGRKDALHSVIPKKIEAFIGVHKIM